MVIEEESSINKNEQLSSGEDFKVLAVAPQPPAPTRRVRSVLIEEEADGFSVQVHSQ